MDNTWPDPSGKEVTDRFVRESAAILRDRLTGIYLHGSAAMGCFHPEKSDLDYLVVVNGPLSDAVKRAYADMTVRLDAEGPAKGIEMSIVARDVCDPFIYPTPFLLHYSRMHTEWYRRDPEDYIRKMNGTDRDLAAHITVIRERGICLYGLPIPEVFGDVPKEDYLESIRRDVAGAEQEIAGNPAYLILNLLRVLAYIKEKRILSKREGGEWGLKNLSPGYHPLIRNALHEYGNEAYAPYDPDILIQFARYMLKQINCVRRTMKGEGKG